MDNSKPWYASTSVWGGVVAVVAPLVGVFFHFKIPDADVAMISDALAAAGAAVGGIIAVYGRVKADSKIGS